MRATGVSSVDIAVQTTNSRVCTTITCARVRSCRVGALTLTMRGRMKMDESTNANAKTNPSREVTHMAETATPIETLAESAAAPTRMPRPSRIRARKPARGRARTRRTTRTRRRRSPAAEAGVTAMDGTVSDGETVTPRRRYRRRRRGRGLARGGRRAVRKSVEQMVNERVEEVLVGLLKMYRSLR